MKGKIIERKDLGKNIKIHCESDFRDIRMYINNSLFFIIPRPVVKDVTKESIWLQSYLVGSKKHKQYYIEVSHSGGKDYYGFDNKEIWKEVLKQLDENI